MKQYQIIIEMLDESTKVEMFDTYKLAMDKYKILKQNSLDNVHIIKFVKIENGNNTILFTKKVSEKVMYSTCRDLAKDVDKLLSEVEKLKKFHESRILISERKRELLLHLISAVHQKKYGSVEEEHEIKLKLFNELAYYEDTRRISKLELDDIYNMQKSSSNLNIDDLLKDKNKPKIYRESTSCTRQRYERLITYADDKEKDKFIKQNKNYAYYIINEYEKSIYFYNRFDGGKAIVDFQKNLQKQNHTKLAVKDIDTNNINNTKSNENACDKQISPDEIKVYEYKTIKQKGHLQRTMKNKYKYNADCTAKQKLYFSNHPIDLDMLV